LHDTGEQAGGPGGAPPFDLIIRNGTVVTASDTMCADVGIRDGRVVALAEGLSCAEDVIDASGLLVVPGGVEGHYHIEQRGPLGW
jgi:dihydropyrimidinase